MSYEGFHREKYPRLTVDYERPTIDVYTDAARHCLENGHLETGSKHKLRLLSLVQHSINDNDDNEASWVPRWDKTYQTWILGLQPYAKFFYASGTLDAHIEQSSSKSHLIIKGLDVDEVVQTDESLSQTANNSPEMFMAVKKLWQSIIADMGKNRPNYLGAVGAEKTFAITLTAGATIDRLARDPEQYNEHDFAAYWLGNAEWEKQYLHQNLETWANDMRIAPKATPSDIHRGLRFGEAICRSRVFFTSANGAMGFGPPTTLPGDRICVLFGSVTPFILRPIDRHYRLVGECFAAGLMHGEAIAGMEAKIIREKVFEIR